MSSCLQKALVPSRKGIGFKFRRTWVSILAVALERYLHFLNLVFPICKWGPLSLPCTVGMEVNVIAFIVPETYQDSVNVSLLLLHSSLMICEGWLDPM